MSVPDPDPEAEPGAVADPPWSFVTLIADFGTEPPASTSDREAMTAWSAVTAPWHPALLHRSATLPRLESVDSPSFPSPREVRIVAGGAASRLPPGYRTQAEDAGSFLLESGEDRHALILEILETIEPGGASASPGFEALTSAADDFLALGTACWWLHDLTIAMAHPDGLDVEALTREALAGALAWRSGDHPTAVNHLRASFEILTQARERFYPVDAYLIDLCLVDPAVPAGGLADALQARAPVTFLAPALAIENLATRDPEAMAAVREAISEGWADVVGGSHHESDEPLAPIESILWQFRRGGEVYRRHLDDRNVETVARRRFALYPQLPQIVKRFGFRFAVHLGFDAGTFPIRPEAKRLWESPDGTSLETLTRPPLAADRAAAGATLPWRLALTMKDDHVATVAFVHWPGRMAPWYHDLRRVAGYSPVLARWVTLNDYFHLTDRPFETFRPEPDAYTTPYLAQAARRRDDRPISRRSRHARLRLGLDAAAVLNALARAISPESSPSPDAGPGLTELETKLETGAIDGIAEALEVRQAEGAAALAQGIAGTTTGGRPGYLVLNPLGIARRVAVILPDAALDLRPEGPLHASQFTDEGVRAIVELPAFGYAWVPRESNLEIPPATSGLVSVRGHVLRNESMVVEIDANTGGIRSIHTPTEETARVGQQLTAVGPDAGGRAQASRMRATRFEVDYGGPALAQAYSRGDLLESGDGRRIATFEQRYRLWSGRPLLELEIRLGDLDPEWLAAVAEADPWSYYLACRWAWPDPSSMIRRTCLSSPEVTEADRPETPDAIDISTRRQRTALLFGGLAHHRRPNPRMLDTLLIAGREVERTFRLGVALDLEHPFHAALDRDAPAPVVSTETGPPRTGPSGWLFQIDNKAVAITGLEYVESTGEGRGWGLAFHLLETAGRPARCRLRAFRDPSWGRQTDFHNELVVDLPIDGDAALVDLTPHELARVELTFG